MRPREDELIDPEIAEQLDAIDATLAGEPVAPRFAELAELALLLSAGRPAGPQPEFASELDRRVQARFGRGEPAAVAAGGGPPPRVGSAGSAGGARWRRWGLMPALGGVATVLAAVVAVVVVTSGGGATLPHAAAPAPRAQFSASPTVPARSSEGLTFGAGQTIHSHAKAAPALAPNPPLPARQLAHRTGVARSTNSVVTGTTQTIGAPAAALPGFTPAAPIPNGRRIVQSSILELGAPARRIDAVAQEIFVVVSEVNGIVNRSNVSSTGGLGANAQFQLRVPSALLPQALSDLSRLRYARVISRTDNTQDVNNSYLSTQRQIAAATAALARLRAKLAAATLASEIASLRVQIAYERATLARTQGSLASLNRRIDYSNLDVSVQATTPLPGGGSRSHSGGFGLGKAGHDALRVLEVMAGVALIALAALVPLGLLLALVWWLALALQRRRRERALDLA